MTRNQPIAQICLTDGSVRLRQADAAEIRQYLGGRGLGMHLLKTSADRHPLMFLAGPLTGSPLPSGGRCCAVTRSADTGLPVSPSSGTCWGAALKRAGLDGVVIEGEAPRWSCLVIEKGTVRLFPAEPYLGMLSGQTEQALKSVWGRSSAVLSIGPAGENLVPMAAVLYNTQRAFSRGGIGKIMGAKRLKAIVVCADSLEEIPANACARCNVPCKKTPRQKAAGDRLTDISSLCDSYGLDCVGAGQVIAAIEALQPGAPADAAYWIREISCPKTELARLAGAGPEALQRALGKESEKPRERAKQHLPENLSAVLDSIGCCLFSASAFTMEDYARMLTEAVGETFSPEDLLEAGARILQLEQELAGCQPSESAR